MVHRGHGPTRTIQTGIGPVEIALRFATADAQRRRADPVQLRNPAEVGTTDRGALLRVLDLRGISIGDFQKALEVVLGEGRSETCRRR